MIWRFIAVGPRLVGRVRVDLRDAVYGLRGGRVATLLAFVILTITMAATTVTFSVVDAVAIRPLPFASPDRLVSLSLPSPTPGKGLPATPHAYTSWLESNSTFESLGAARAAPAMHLEVGDGTETLTTRRVSANLFDVLGVRPAVGRFFGPEHEQPGGPAAIILTHALWVRRFGADPAVIGRRMKFVENDGEVIGVLPAGVWYPVSAGPPPDLYLPYVVTTADRANNRSTSLFVIGRLRRGVSLEQARADVERLGSVLMLSLHDQVVGPAKTSMVLVLMAVVLVLLVASVNVANLLLARAVTRLPELATRAALGASRQRLALSLIIEGLILSVASAAAAVVMSFWGVEIARSILPPGLARVSAIGINARVLSTSIAAGLLCGILCAGAPAWLASQRDLASVMKGGVGPIVGSRRDTRWLGVFLVADIAFVCVLLVATVLVVTSFRLITTADLGFERQNVMFLWYQQSLKEVARADRPSAIAALRSNLIERGKSVPGVTDVAIMTTAPPLSGTRYRVSVVIPGLGETVGDMRPEMRVVSPDYFRVMAMRLISGRQFHFSDRSGAPQVMIINDIAARRYFPDRDAIGQVVAFRGPTTIIGVVKGSHNDGPESEVRPEVYTPLDQEPYHDFDVTELGGAITAGGLVLRTSRDARALAPSVLNTIRPGVTRLPNPPEFVDDYFRRLTAVRRFNAQLMGVFGLLAVAIGAIGVYGTMAFVVAREVPAIGLRMALGASPAVVMSSALREALQRVAVGIALGWVGAWFGSNALESFVFGIRPTDLTVYGAVGGFLAVIGVAAGFIPALRAARVNPLAALRCE